MADTIFHPTFGSRPDRIVGRDAEIETFLEGLSKPIGARERCLLVLGQRGMGKTALLLEMEDRASERGFIVARVSHNEEMLEEIIELIQIKGSPFAKSRKHPVRGFSAGALGFSVGLTFSEETQQNFGFRVKLAMLCDKLEESGLGVLILVDEAKTSPRMRQLATTYQHLVGEAKNIAICMAGLPHAVSSVLNDDVLTFLNRARKLRIGPISTASVQAYYADAFKRLGLRCDTETLTAAAEATQGFPYLMQLIGYYAVEYAKPEGAVDDRVLEAACSAAAHDLEDGVFAPIIAALSPRDLEVLCAMAQDGETSKVSDIIARMHISDSYFQPYRARLIDAGVVESPRRGELAFAVPLLADYLKKGF